MTDRNGAYGSWQIRRRLMFVQVAFNMFVIAYVLIAGLDTAPAEVAVLAATGSNAAILSAYVFGAVWDDNNIRSKDVN